jgi:ammonium transporter, Amt family
MNDFDVTPAIIWLACSTCMVFLMQLGFSLLEAGLVRAKNTVNVIMKNYIDMCVGATGYWMVGYGMMFGLNETGWIGTTEFFKSSGTPFEFTNLFYQAMFAATAGTIISGAIAERIRYTPYIVHSTLICVFAYPIYGGWVWNEGGWLYQLGFLDFAGSGVVHLIGGAAALAAVIVLGPRLGRFSSSGVPRDIPGHNLPLFAAGAFILWFGWFGFNGGSIFGVKGGANLGLVLLNTYLGGSMGTLACFLLLKLLDRPITMGDMLNAGLGGMVAITASAAFVSPPFALVIGALAGIAVPWTTALLLNRFKLDDAVGAIPVHMGSGIIGLLCLGLFHRDTGLMAGGENAGFTQLGVQALGAAVAVVWAFSTSYLFLKLVALMMPLRVDSKAEQRGLDYAEHAEVSYPEFGDGFTPDAKG